MPFPNTNHVNIYIFKLNVYYYIFYIYIWVSSSEYMEEDTYSGFLTIILSDSPTFLIFYRNLLSELSL